MINIFMSLHHDECLEIAETLMAFIKREIIDAPVFLADQSRDVSSIYEQIMGRIDKCDTFLMLLGPSWASRLHDNNDWVCREALHALRRNKHIVLYMSKEFSKLPANSDVPKVMQALFDSKVIREQGALLDALKEKAKAKRRACTKPIVYLSSAVYAADHAGPLDYFSVVVNEIAIMLQKQQNVIDFVLKIPKSGKENEVRSEQVILLQRIIANIDRYRALILAPFDTSAIANDLGDLMKQADTIPVLTIDKCFRNGGGQFEKSPLGVMADWRQGGTVAAGLLMRHCALFGIKSPRVVILRGLEGSKERIDGFLSALEEVMGSKVKDEVTELKGEFQRDSAMLSTLAFLSGRKTPRKDVQAFFCCNDEMALGVRDALIPKPEAYQGIKIIGFDGIRDVAICLRKQENDHFDPYLLNTVDVRVNMQVGKLYDMLGEFLNGRLPKEDKPVLIECKPYIDAHVQDTRSQIEITKMHPGFLDELRGGN